MLLAKGLQSVHLLLKIDGTVNKVVSFSFAVPYTACEISILGRPQIINSYLRKRYSAVSWFGLIEPVFVFSILYKKKTMTTFITQIALNVVATQVRKQNLRFVALQ